MLCNHCSAAEGETTELGTTRMSRRGYNSCSGDVPWRVSIVCTFLVSVGGYFRLFVFCFVYLVVVIIICLCVRIVSVVKWVCLLYLLFV